MTGLLARSNPLLLLAWAALAMVAAVAVRDLLTGVVMLALVVGIGLVVLPGRSGPRLRYLVVLLAALSTGWSTWLVGDHDLVVAVTAGLRVSVLALPGVALAPLVDPSELADQLAQRLKLPARGVIAVTAALQRIDLMAETWRQVSRTRRARGGGPGRGPASQLRHLGSVSFAVLVATMRQATAMATAMDARGFDGADRRSWAELGPWRRSDTALLVLGVVLTILPYVLWWSR